MKHNRVFQWKCADRLIDVGGRPLIMGILNVTPDSFSDGGRYAGTEGAVVRGLQMVEEGADILDIGGESTRPGAVPVPVEEELARVVPVVRELKRRTDVPISIDTAKAEVAKRAIEAGAVLVNDVTAMTGDPQMPETVLAARAGAVLMHMRGTPRTMQNNPEYANVTAEVVGFLKERIKALTAIGLTPDSIAMDPGIGFGKTLEHNLTILANLDQIAELGFPVVIGLSRKSFIGKITGADVNDRVAGSISGAVMSVIKGANVLRVHDVRDTRDAVLVASAVMQHERR